MRKSTEELMMAKKGKAVYFTAPGKVETRTESISPDAQKEAPQELVLSEVMGISHGTELLFYRGEIEEGSILDENLPALEGAFHYPVKYGYINVGTTESGTRVFCFFPHQTAFYLQSREWIEVPNDIESRDALFLASMETAAGIVQDCAPVLGENIMVIGQGVIGLLVTSILTRYHCGTVITVEPYKKRREMSQQFGATVIDPGGVDVRELVFSFTSGRGADKVINVSGNSAGLQTGIDSLVREGTLIEASWYGTKRIEARLGGAFHRKRLRVVSSQVSTVSPLLSPRWDKARRLELVWELVRSINPSVLITHEFSIERADEAFELIDKRAEDTIQVVLTP
jgi:NADPH:quinone reductase-like Zn-dependent oxidoreductase